MYFSCLILGLKLIMECIPINVLQSPVFISLYFYAVLSSIHYEQM